MNTLCSRQKNLLRFVTIFFVILSYPGDEEDLPLCMILRYESRDILGQRPLLPNFFLEKDFFDQLLTSS